MIRYTLQERLTHRYVDGYAHLDEWGQDFKFKELGGRITKYNDDSYTRLVRVIGSKTKSQSKQIDVLRGALSTNGCSHEHDCCGCEIRYASVRKIKRGVFSVSCHVTWNF